MSHVRKHVWWIFMQLLSIMSRTTTHISSVCAVNQGLMHWIHTPDVRRDSKAFLSCLRGLKIWPLVTFCMLGLSGFAVDPLLAGHVELLKDINKTGTDASEPGEFAVLGDLMLFAAADGAHGRELWITDGTVTGTTLVKDINPGVEDSSPSCLAAWNGLIYFAADDGVHGEELWTSNGTTEGTTLFKDIYQGSFDSDPTYFTAFERRLYFSARDSHGQELWVTDGTESGTKLFYDVNPTGFSYPRQLTVVSDKLFFVPYSYGMGGPLWVTDGTEAGTVCLEAVTECHDLVSFNGQLYCFARYHDGFSLRLGICASDGTPEGTQGLVPLWDAYGASGLTPANGILYFAHSDPWHGEELWSSNGVDDAHLVKDLNPNNKDPHFGPYNFLEFDDGIVFAGYGGFWRSDGTEEGTYLLNNYRPWNNIVVLEDTIYYASAWRLWKSDGTVEGTELVREGFTGDAIGPLTIFEGNLWFSADDRVVGSELWKSDGTTAGTMLFKDIRIGSGSSNVREVATVPTGMFFQAQDGLSGAELWFTDGTETGTALVKDIQAGEASSYPQGLTVMDGRVFFSAHDGVHGQELWVSDRSEVGTEMVCDIRVGTNSSYPTKPVIWQNRLYFWAGDDMHGRELWSSDGTAAGSSLIKDIALGSALSHCDSDAIVAVGDTLLFFANDGVTGCDLWRSDGTEAGTYLVKDIAPGASAGSCRWLTSFGDRVIFCAYEEPNGSEPWISDGTEAGTVLLKDIAAGTASSTGYEESSIFAPCGDRVFFTAHDGVHGRELWITSGREEDTNLVRDIASGSVSGVSSYSASALFAGPDDRVYFSANDSINGVELWVSDGTEVGTYLVRDIRPGPASSYPRYMVSEGDLVFFRADDGENGSQLWVTDGTTEGTVMVKRISQNPYGSSPWPLITWNKKVFFMAKDDVHGDELWYSRFSFADLTEDGNINFFDYALLSEQWLQTGCTEVNGWCTGPDIDHDGAVGIDDLLNLSEQWLR